MTFDIKRIIAEKFRHANDITVTMSVIMLQKETQVRGMGRVESRAGKELVIKSLMMESEKLILVSSHLVTHKTKHAASQLSPSIKQE